MNLHPFKKALDKIEVEMIITDNLREFTTRDSKLFDKDFNGPLVV
jgi:hypothetical protein